MNQTRLFILSAFMILGIVKNGWADETPTIVASGNDCGQDCFWSLDSNGTLTISGQGAIQDYEQYTAPWYKHRLGINNISISDGITSIGDNAFRHMGGVLNVDLPKGLQTIGQYAFSGAGLTALEIPESVYDLGVAAFNSNNLTSIKVPDGISELKARVFSSNPIHELIIPENITGIDEYAFYCYGCESTQLGQTMPLEKIYCSTNMLKACQKAVSYFDTDVEIEEYQIYDNAYYYNGKFYKSAHDIGTQNNIKKRIYTVDEANKVAGERNTVTIRYR